MAELVSKLTYEQRLEALRESKMRQTEEKWEVVGSMDGDDHGRILPPIELREVRQINND